MSFARSSNNFLAAARIWHHVDAKDKPLGSLASRIAVALMGKYKPTFDPSMDFGDYVVVTNCRHVYLSEIRKSEQRYRWHTKYPGGFRDMAYRQFLEKHPCGTVRKAVYGMLPRNNLRKQRIERLLLFPESEHPYAENILRHYDTYDLQTNVKENISIPPEELQQLLDASKTYSEKFLFDKVENYHQKV